MPKRHVPGLLPATGGSKLVVVHDYKCDTMRVPFDTFTPSLYCDRETMGNDRDGAWYRRVASVHGN